jgi:internalin A
MIPKILLSLTLVAVSLSGAISPANAKAQPKTFLEWCKTYKSAPKGTQETVKELIAYAASRGANDCNSVDKIMSQTTAMQFSFANGKDITPLASLPKLRHLNAFWVRDLQGFTMFPKLVTLKIETDSDSNAITSLAPLAALKNLQGLEIENGVNVGNNGKIADISAISGMKSLRYFSLKYGSVANIAPLAKVSSLQALSLIGNQVKDVKPLAGLQNLVMVELSENQISSAAPLGSLKKLKHLLLYGNPAAEAKDCPLFETVCDWTSPSAGLAIDSLFTRGL